MVVIPVQAGNSIKDRAISLLGLVIFQFGFWATSADRTKVKWRTVIFGLIFQQVLALFVIHTSAGFDLFSWIAKAFTDLLDTGTRAGGFFFNQQVLDQHWFFVNVLAAIIYFIALVQLLYYLGVMQWILLNLGYFFFKVMDVSGAEAVVAAASPFVGQSESVMLVRPFVSEMTDSELHQVVTSGFATIAGSVLVAYVSLGMPAVYLISASIMSIPASLAVSKLRFPETGSPLTAGTITIPESNKTDLNPLHAFSNGAWFGLRVAGMILANVLSVLALVYTIDGLLTWIGQFWSLDPKGPHPLTLELIFQYLFYPIAWLMGTPSSDVMKVSRLLGLKLVANEFVASLSKLQPEMTTRGFTIATYSLCGFANLSGLGIQIGVLSSLVPNRQADVGKIVVSALICGFFSTIQTAGKFFNFTSLSLLVLKSLIVTILHLGWCSHRWYAGIVSFLVA
ncbi:Na+ dependent nucleoside transporter C-terminus-domain-containing protein [Melampsora americana]|nr:Na+ dependent nucleoside transporter C-terminus-domain-containing protein [Melampsora americana]